MCLKNLDRLSTLACSLSIGYCSAGLFDSYLIQVSDVNVCSDSTYAGNLKSLPSREGQSSSKSSVRLSHLLQLCIDKTLQYEQAETGRTPSNMQ